MTVLTAMQSAAMKLIGRKPSNFFGSSETFEQEICNWANEVAVDMAQYQDWQELTRIGSFVGDGVQKDFGMPFGYDRMCINTNLQDLSNWFWGFTHLTDMNQYMYYNAQSFFPNPGAWIMFGDAIHFTPAPADGQAASFPYITHLIVKGYEGFDKREFDNDSDIFILDERVLSLGIVARWRDNKGLDANGDYEAYAKALDESASKAAGSRIIRRNQGTWLANTRIAWPWALGGQS